ncbi:peptidase M24, structural domain-containing protein [Fimicolochytrium jonesii]|uniref:peptidase M24, structural domain-containing protein n=1 Tax=Fimicolochytrium jonesii TaxID=1396493 RepID=UPI0022FEA19A|nr:peptidase M24, structural domain-containing protein [Fimicolochytrium jonesii]KAI8825170.1 peptidase M24, structural domain-containing protein [Fimicolochytrium jonesii]
MTVGCRAALRQGTSCLPRGAAIPRNGQTSPCLPRPHPPRQPPQQQVGCSRPFSTAGTPPLRRRNRTSPSSGPLSASQRLSIFGSYDLILPRVDNLNGNVLRQQRRPVPNTIPIPDRDENECPVVTLNEPHLKTEKELVGLRKACALAKRALEEAGRMVEVGVTTDEIDRRVHEFIIQNGAYPSPLGHIGFPKSICTSINNVICHGIPDSRPLQDGDIINIDITVYLQGYHGDTSATFPVGTVDARGLHLVAATKDAMNNAIALCGPGVPLNQIGHSISTHAHASNYTTSPDFCGHGIGTQFHEPPMIYHFENTCPGVMAQGMTFTVEPMLCQGACAYVLWPDCWTAVTRDGGRSAQFEHTILITSSGAEILT